VTLVIASTVRRCAYRRQRPVEQVRDALGHSMITMTNTYVRTRLGNLRKAFKNSGRPIAPVKRSSASYNRGLSAALKACPSLRRIGGYTSAPARIHAGRFAFADDEIASHLYDEKIAMTKK
jgi:hypothetical protein